MWCVPEIDNEFVERMEDVLRLYARRYNPNEPVVAFDERPVVLHDSARKGTPVEPGRLPRTDYEYVRCGTANIFCIVEPLTGQRLTHVTQNRKSRSFAWALTRIARRYRHARRIHLVLDNLSTHAESAVIAAYGPRKGSQLWRRFTVHYTPKHASWLNAAELEASLVARECLGRRRMADYVYLKKQVKLWTRRTNRQRRFIRWKFRVNDARRVFRYNGITTRRSEH